MKIINLDNIIICPKCKKNLVKLENKSEYLCNNCGSVYPINDSIPTFLEEIREPETN